LQNTCEELNKSIGLLRDRVKELEGENLALKEKQQQKVPKEDILQRIEEEAEVLVEKGERNKDSYFPKFNTASGDKDGDGTVSRQDSLPPTL